MMKLIISSVSVSIIVSSFVINNLAAVATKLSGLPQNQAVLSATKSVAPSSTPVPTSEAGSQDFSSYIYPGSKVIEQTADNLVLEAAAEPDKVTSWYKDLLKQLDLPVNSNVTTNTNGKIDNKLVSSDGSKKVEVSITKYPDSGIVFVNILLR